MKWKFDEDQDVRISRVVQDLSDEFAIMEEWFKCIQETVQFPFKARVFEIQEKSSVVQYGDVLKVHSIDDIGDKYGIIAHARLGRKKIYFPLCELEVIELNDMERKVIDDYSVWFANR